MTTEWGPWIEHDGRGCPVSAGTVVHCVEMYGSGDVVDFEGVATDPPCGGSWNWANYPMHTKILRYRIRKSRALEQLREIARNPERELEDA